jgi:hypothetical protein
MLSFDNFYPFYTGSSVSGRLVTHTVLGDAANHTIFGQPDEILDTVMDTMSTAGCRIM